MSKGVPKDIEAESALLGALLGCPDKSDQSDLLEVVLEQVDDLDFYVPANRAVFRAIVGVVDKGQAADSVTVADWLANEGLLEEAGGKPRLIQLIPDSYTATSAPYYAAIIAKKSKQRQVLQLCVDVGGKAEESTGDPDLLIEEAERRIFEINQRRQASHAVSVSDTLSSVFQDLEAYRAGVDTETVVQTGFVSLNEMIHGFRSGEFAVLAARPSMGKTTFALNLITHIATAGIPVLLFSLEMSATQVTRNMACGYAGVSPDIFKTRRGEDAQFNRLLAKGAELQAAPIWIEEPPGLNPTLLRSKCRRMVRQHGIGIVVIDYLQLMSMAGKVESRQQEVATISRSLKQLARELKIPVVALAQLNRAVEQREDKRPRMSDLRESGAIEQDADVIMFLHRDDYYEPGGKQEGLAQVIVAKQRNGAVGTVTLAYLKDRMRFENYTAKPEGF